MSDKLNDIFMQIDLKRLPSLAMAMAAKHQGRIGILAEEQHKDSEFTTAALAAVHEWGSLDGHIPERSFFRLTESKKSKEMAKFVKDNEEKILSAIMERRFLPILEKLAAKWEAYIHECFETEGWGTWEELEDSTLAARMRKGNDVDTKILQDTGQLERSIVSEVK